MSDVKLETPPSQPVLAPVPKKKKRKWGRIIVLIIILGIIALAVWFWLQRAKQPQMQVGSSYADHTVETRDITLTLSGTGTLKPADSYTVTTLISGEILNAPFEEGGVVEKDNELYKVDSSSVSTSIEQAENALAQTRRTYEQRLKTLSDLQIKASGGGTVIELTAEPGDKISAGQTVARIRDSSVMTLTVPFAVDDAVEISKGDRCVVTLDSSFEQLEGTVTKISPVPERLEGNMLVQTVTIDVKNPGGISPDQAATAAVGDIYCGGSGNFSYKSESVVTAAISGEVSVVHADEGDNVQKNELLITLVSDSLQNDLLNSESALRDGELSLQNRYDQLDSYTIKSPISGTIIEKNYKEGDTLESGKILCTIFDLSYLTITLNIDELDISRVKEGQNVTITAEALPGGVYTGSVTKVNINGTTSSGVTTYPVTIRIDETEGLMPGMNVQASIVVSQSKDSVAIPVSALSRGNRVLVKTDAPQQPVQQDDGSPAQPGAQTGGFGSGPSMGAEIPAGFTYVEVTPGISDGSFIEIVGGLKTGDVIAVPELVIPDAMQFFGMGPGGGGPPSQGDGNVTVTRTGPGG